MGEVLTPFVNQLKSIFGENVVSIVLYGSRVIGEETKKFSDYNLLVLLKDADPSHLRHSSKAIGKWVRQGNPPPLVFTVDRFRMSADVFPIEFYDMRDHHKILHGEDPFETLELHPTHLRHECEFELKGKLLKLRQGYLVAEGHAKRIQDLLMGSLSTFLILSRAVLRLLEPGKSPPDKKVEALERLAEHVGLNKEPFMTILRMREGEKFHGDADQLMAEYTREIEKVVDLVDHLDVKRS